MTKRMAIHVLLAVGLLGWAAGAAAQSVTALRVIVFPGGGNWPLWVAEDKGFLARERLKLELTDPTRYYDLSYHERALRGR